MFVAYSALALIGFNTRRVLEQLCVVEHNDVGINPLIGLALVQILCWYQLRYFANGISFVTSAVLLASLLYGVIQLRNTRGAIKIELLKHRWLLITLMVSTILFLFQWHSLLSTGYLSAASPNGDIAAYAQIAQHIEHHSFVEAGRIGGANLGSVARTDVTGAYVLVNFVRQVTSVDLHQILLPTLGIANLFVAHALFKLLRRTTKLKPAVVVLLAVFPQSTFMSMYLMGNFFLAQIMAMAASIVLLEILLSADSHVLSSFKFAIKNIWIIAVPVVVLLLTYPHMAFVVPPILILVVVPKMFKSQFRHFVLVTAMVGSGAVLLLLGKFSVAFQRMKDLAGDKVNGWPLPGLYPSEIFGLQWSESLKPTNGDLVASVVLLLVVVVSIFVIRRRGSNGLPSVSILIWLGGTYMYMYWSSGVSYRQWKWITFFQPFLLTAALVPMCIAIFLIMKNRRMALPLVCLLLSGLIAGNYQRTMSYSDGVVTGTYLVEKKTAQLGRELGGLKRLNIKTGPYLESMWPAYFARNQETNILDPSYYSSSLALAAPTLVSKDFQVSDGVEYQELKSGYKLVGFPSGNTSVSLDGLASKIEIKRDSFTIGAGKEVTFNVLVTNTGQSAWLGGGLSVGSVNIGARVILKNGTQLNSEISRSTIVEFPNYVRPDEDRLVLVRLKIDQPGDYLVEISPVAEGLAWFSELNKEYAQLIRVQVS
jgi:hypothetical protein